MERVLGILGSAILLSVLSITLLIVDSNFQASTPSDKPTDIDSVPYDQLSDSQKLQRLSLPANTSDDTLLNRALAYGNATYCDPIRDGEMKTKCRTDVSQVKGDRFENTTEEAITSTDRQLYNRAKAYQDPDLCEQIVLGGLRKRCIENVS